jgi:hypothetical protein
MIIISQGLGFLVLVFGVLWLMLDRLIAQQFPGDRWMRTLALLGVCVVIAAIGFVFNRKQPSQYVNQGGAAHSLYWIPMEYWSIVVLALGAMAIFGLG